MSYPGDPFSDKMKILGGTIVLLGLIVAISLLGYQLFFWLRDGFWTPISLLWLLRKIGVTEGWFVHPDSWYGLHKLFVTKQLFIVIPIISLLMGSALWCIGSVVVAGLEEWNFARREEAIKREHPLSSPQKCGMFHCTKEATVESPSEDGRKYYYCLYHAERRQARFQRLKKQA